jgi:hypothetical protein
MTGSSFSGTLAVNLAVFLKARRAFSCTMIGRKSSPGLYLTARSFIHLESMSTAP